jgi:hypothetical protein
MKRIEIIKEIRKQLRSPVTNWEQVDALCSVAKLIDTDFLDKLRDKNKYELMKDYLLDLKYHKKHPIQLHKLY